jgi:hypothetical protein
MTTRPHDYFRKIAIVWLRLTSVLFILYGLITAVFLTRWESPGPNAFLGPALYALGGLLLWFLSEPLGRLVARGLDDPGSGPPAA